MFATHKSEYFDHKPDQVILQYRNQFCRICLNHFKDDFLVSIDTHAQDITLLEMLIQLTAFETEENDAFPGVICMQCKYKLEFAFNIRQEFIAQAEHLVQLVAEQKIITYFGEFLSDTYDPATADETTADDTATADETIAADEPTTVNELDTVNESTTVDETNTAVEEQMKTEDTACKEEHSNDHSSYARVFDEFDLYCRDKEAVLEQKRIARIEREKIRYRERYLAAKARKTEEAYMWKTYPPTTCYVCDKKHDTITQRDYHLREHVPMLPYECNECRIIVAEDGNPSTASCVKTKPLIVRSTIRLNLHFMMHRMPHKCGQCYRRFSSVINLNTHLWSAHTPSKDGLTCEYCGKRFFHRNYFNAHVAHHRNKISGQFKCKICERAFGAKMLLERHERSHTGEKKFKCLYCDQSFTRSCNRLTHQRTHTGERTFKCRDCDLSYMDSGQLRQHRATSHRACKGMTRRPLLPFTLDESGTKHYICQYEEGCSFTTTIGQKMSLHKANHIKRFECDECGKRFANGTRVVRHKESMHSGKNKKRNRGTADTRATTADTSSEPTDKWIIEQQCEQYIIDPSLFEMEAG